MKTKETASLVKIVTILFAKYRTKFLLLSTLVALVACDSVHIAPKPEDQFSQKESTTLVCTEEPKALGQYTKVMFVVDKSGSNAEVPTDAPRMNGKRYTAIKDFLEKNRNNPYISWGFIEFHADQAKSYIPAQNGDPNRIFTSDPNLMDQALAQFAAEADADATPFRSAIALTTSALQAELHAQNGTSSNYNIIFLSDGVPTDYGFPPNDAAILADVGNLVALSPGNIHFSTVYYGTNDPDAHARLKKMADAGKGIFQDTNISPIINIDNFIIGRVSYEPYIIKNFVVYNLNAANCLDGSVGGDSAATGICDKDKIYYNTKYKNSARFKEFGGKTFDPTNRNSFLPNLSDQVMFHYIAYGESIRKDCADKGSTDVHLANNCEKNYFNNDSPQGPTPQWTDEMIRIGKHGDTNYFDSDGDGILDMLAFMFFNDKSAPLNYNNQFQRNNGYQNDYLFANHLNPKNPGSEIPYGINFQRVEPNDKGQNCYSYKQNDLPLHEVSAVTPTQVSGLIDLAHNKDENVILIYYIEVPEYAPNSKGLLRYSFQRLTKDKNKVQDLNLDTSKFYLWTPTAPNTN